MDEYICNLLISIAVGGIIVAWMNIRKALLLGVSVTWLAMFGLFVLILSDMNKTTQFSKDLFKQNGVMMFSLMLIAYYIYLIRKHDDYISENKMPDNWYQFSYFTLIAITGLVGTLSVYMKDRTAKRMHVLAGVIFCSLLGFIVIETIIATYYRTDGFTV